MLGCWEIILNRHLLKRPFLYPLQCLHASQSCHLSMHFFNLPWIWGFRCMLPSHIVAHLQLHWRAHADCYIAASTGLPASLEEGKAQGVSF